MRQRQPNRRVTNNFQRQTYAAATNRIWTGMKPALS